MFNNLYWAMQQIDLGNKVARACLPNVYLKNTEYYPGNFAPVMYYTADDTAVISVNVPYRFTLDDANNSDWVLVP